MIEGLKVTITGQELKELCVKRSEFHIGRSKVYQEQLCNMENTEVEGMTYSNGDPKRSLKDKKDQHLSDAGELEFISKHLNLNEEYLLDITDLVKLGIAKSRY